MHPALRATLVLLTFLTAPAACGGADSASTPAATAAGTPAPATSAKTQPAAAQRREGERPLPSFEGHSLDGQALSISSFIGKRLVLFFFNPEVEEAALVARAVSAVAGERRRHNFGLVGVAIGSTAERARTFAREHGFDFPIFDDSNARISSRLGLRAPVVLLAIDAEGYLGFGMGSFSADVRDADRGIEEQLREHLRLPRSGEAHASAALGDKPLAPLFEAQRLDGGERFELAALRGKPVVLVFFLHTCPHCHKALRFFHQQIEQMPEEKRPALVGISVQDKVSAVQAALRKEELDFFPVLLDSDQSIRSAYGVFGGVPDIVLIDAEGRIAHRVHGWSEERDPALARMVMAKLSGLPIPMLLNPQGFTGSDVCSVCHEAQGETWLFTQHATAFDTLVTHGADRNAECVGCHVVGFEQPGGWALDSRPAHLEDVGCEVCHGRGGPHLSPQSAKTTNYEPICSDCHDAKHSLGFDTETFLPRISHRAIAAMDPQERETLLAGRGVARGLLPSTSKIVGSEACQSCHEAEYALWASSAHARSIASLDAQGHAQNEDCQRCHTTGFGRPGGFPKGAAPESSADLARVGCESCHGAGEEHIAEGSRKTGNVIRLGDKCDSCVILQICGSCHDDANDPDFRFQVEQRIDKQRHGGSGQAGAETPE